MAARRKDRGLSFFVFKHSYQSHSRSGSDAVKSYSLARRQEETRLNAYNAAMLLAWKGNIDVQPLIDNPKKCLQYVVKYASKGESKNKAGTSRR